MCYQNRQHQLPEQQGYGTLNAKGVQLHWVTSKSNLAALMCPCQLEMHSGVSLSNEAFYLFSGDVWRRQETNMRYTHTLGSLNPSEHCDFFVPLPLFDILKRRRKWTYTSVCEYFWQSYGEKYNDMRASGMAQPVNILAPKIWRSVFPKLHSPYFRISIVVIIDNVSFIGVLAVANHPPKAI